MKLTIQNFGLSVTLIFLLSLCLFGCSSDEEVGPGDTLFPTGAELERLIAQAIDVDSLQERGRSGEELYYAPNQETPYTGWVKRYHDDDEEQIYILRQIHNGKNHGAYIQWYENGQKEVESTYKEGERDGKWTEWYSNGQKRGEGTFKEGEPDGAWTIWYSNGQKGGEGTFKEGQLNGALTFWYENGQEWRKGTFKEDVRDGAWTFWYENGQKAAEGTYDAVEIVREEDTLFEAERVGKWTFWYENGERHAEGRYIGGKRDGAWTFWYDNGQKAAEGTYKEGQRNADWLYWSEDGEPILSWSFDWWRLPYEYDFFVGPFHLVDRLH